MTRPMQRAGGCWQLVVWLALAAACLAGFGASLPARAQDLQPVPKLVTRVTDQTGTLTADQRNQIEAQLSAIEQRKGSQVAVLIVAGTKPEAIEEYSLRVVEAWKLGRAQVGAQKVDDGVLLLIAKNERKLRIEVGRGLEGAIPDALAKRIIAETIAPRFKQGDFAGGVSAGIAEIGRLIDGEALPAPWKDGHAPGGGPEETDWILGLVVAVILGLGASAVIGRFFGAIGAGAGGGIFSMMQGVPLATGAVVGIGAFLAVLVLASMRGGGGRGGNAFGRGGRGSRNGGVIWTGGGGGWGGGSSGGGGGGFSGGGGDFGGGGASGDW